eukprot:TRINITY_DN76491_c0_g1_i1.p1 TRINITY_DN76491_c0_g1~~TRINITY_DN76491_c0_g1_i1.p1  ORF type:complete len:196 (+),score=37.88 TRINITY_DN76491_c0_g1_i1:44-631(+)
MGDEALPEASSSQSICPLARSPTALVDLAMQLAHVSPRDLLLDLGCGDGRVLTTAAGGYGARCVGFDVDPCCIRTARRAVEEANLTHRVQVLRYDLVACGDHPSFQEATVLYLYLIPKAVQRLQPLLESAVKAGKRVLIYCTSGTRDMPGNRIGNMQPAAEAMLGMLRMYCSSETYAHLKTVTPSADECSLSEMD